MPTRLGREYNIGIAKETTRGTPVTPSFWIPRKTFDFEEKREIIFDDQGYGRIEDITRHKIVSQWAEGTFGGITGARSIGLFLLGVLGSVTTTGPDADGIYTHTFSVGQNVQHPSLTFSVKDPDAGRAFALAMLKTFRLSIETGGFAEFESDFMSKKAVSATLTPFYVLEDNFVGGNTTVKFADTKAGLNAAPVIKAITAEINYNKNLEKDDILGSFDPNDFFNKQFQIELTLTKKMEDETYKSYFKDGAMKAMRLLFSTGTGATLRSIQTDLNQVIFTDWASSRGLDEIVVETITMKASFKLADAEMVSVILKNNQTSY